MPPLRRAAWPDTSERSVFPARRYNEPDFLLSCLAENHYTHRYYETCNARASLCTGSACSEDEQRDLRLPLWKAFADLCEQPEQPDRGDALRGDAARRDRSQGRRGHFQQCRPGLEPYLLFPDADSRAAADAREAGRPTHRGVRFGGGFQGAVHQGRRGAVRLRMGVAGNGQGRETVDRRQAERRQPDDRRTASGDDRGRLGARLSTTATAAPTSWRPSGS